MPSKVLTRHPKFMSLFPNMPCRNYCSIHRCLNFSCLFFFAILIILMLANCYMGGKDDHWALHIFFSLSPSSSILSRHFTAPTSHATAPPVAHAFSISLPHSTQPGMEGEDSTTIPSVMASQQMQACVVCSNLNPFFFFMGTEMNPSLQQAYIRCPCSSWQPPPPTNSLSLSPSL